MHLRCLDHVVLLRSLTRIVRREGIALATKKEGSVMTSPTGRFRRRSFHVNLVRGDSTMRSDLTGSDLCLSVSEDEGLGKVSRVSLRLRI